MHSEKPRRGARIRQISLATAVGIALCWSPCRADEGAASSDSRSSVDIELYGYFKLDAAYDSARTSTGDFVQWVELAPGNENDDAFNMTANQSRFGLKIGPRRLEDGEQAPRVETSGRLEVDFYGGGAANKSRLMLRHAYLRALWPESGLELLAGQTSDLISPLNPRTLNYSVAWWGGNIGYRRPQLRLTRRVERTSGRRLEVAAALARTIGATDSEFTGNDAGADSGLPSVQARLGLETRGGSVLGVSGHLGEEEFDRSSAGDAVTFDSWSVNLDWKTRLGSRTVLQAELFSGENLQSYLGGVGQGVNLRELEEIGASGGWVGLTVEGSGDWSYAFGASVDDVRDRDIDTGDRARNLSLFANGIYALSEHLEIGGELSHWATEYKNLEEATALRGQFSIVYRF